MIQIIDNTLTEINNPMLTYEELHTFCKLLLMIGVDIIELSVSVYEAMLHLPVEGKYILRIDRVEEIDKYPGFYRYVCRHDYSMDYVINEVQINDVREVVKLRTVKNRKELRIVGLDDLICSSYDKVFCEILKLLPKSRINLCPENTYGCACALSVHWLMNYGTDITTSFAGIKNNAATEEVIMALRLAIRHKPNRNLTVLPELTSLFEHMTGRAIGNKKPIIGKSIFKVESGIHADGIMKNPSTYEVYQPQCVGKKSEIVIGKHSGISAIKAKLQEAGICVPPEDILSLILEKVKRKATDNRNSLRDDEFINLVLEVISNERNEAYH